MGPTTILGHSLISDEMMRQAIIKCLAEGGFKFDGNHYYIDGEISKQRIRQFHQLAYMKKLDKSINDRDGKQEHFKETGR